MYRLPLVFWLLLAAGRVLSAQDFPAETLVCRTGPFTLVSPLNDGNAYNYRWERSFDGGTTWAVTGNDDAALVIPNPTPGVRYRLGYAIGTTCLANPLCRQLTGTTELRVNIPAFSQGVSLCAGDTLFVGNIPLTTAGNHETILPTAAGCDSVVTTFIDLLPAYDDLFFVELCPGEMFRGQAVARDTVIQNITTSSTGCDSITTYEITVAFGQNPTIQGPAAICAGETAELSAPGLYAGYAWTTGANDENTEVTAGGTYELTLTDFSGCQLTLSHELTVTDLRIDEVLTTDPACPGAATGQLSLSASGDGELLYSVDGGETFLPDSTFSDLSAGSYDLVVESAGGCRAVQTVELMEAPELILNSPVPEELTIERGDSVVLDVAADFPVAEYRWSARNFISCDDCPAPVVYPTADMAYTVEAVAQGGCSVTRTFAVTVLDNRRLYAPTAFSPNGDDRNDRWRIFTGPRATAIAGLQIADRWGGIRYVQPEPELPPDAAGWDGNDGSGQQLDPGVYFYTAVIRFTDGSTKTVGGEITLMR